MSRFVRRGPAPFVAALTTLVVLVTSNCGTSAAETAGGGTEPAGRAPASGFPALRVSTPATGLTQPWDVQVLPGGAMLITERETRRLILQKSSFRRVLSFPSSSVWASGETGLMSLEVDPNFSENRRIYTCQGGFTSGGGNDVRVVAWKLNAAATGVTRVRTLLAGIPAKSGRHGGCRLLIGQEGALYVGTGDATIGTAPQDRTSLAGKVLRLNRVTGAPWPTNPFRTSSSTTARYVLSYGHRNIQGLAQRGDGRIWSIEHGTDVDDEVNLIQAGGNYGWNPAPGYQEQAPMTDQSLPGAQIEAKWRSGDPTIATSGGTWVRGSKWGAYANTLAVAALKGSRVLFMKFSADGTLQWVRTPAALSSFGRLRSISQSADGNLLITTANGSNDRVIRVSPN